MINVVWVNVELDRFKIADLHPYTSGNYQLDYARGVCYQGIRLAKLHTWLLRADL